jgi:hypothetical protein
VFVELSYTEKEIMALSNSTPLRLSDTAETALRALQDRTLVNRATLLRLAIAAGLPIVAKQFVPTANSKPAKKRKAARVARK